MEGRQRPGWPVVPAPDHVSGDRPDHGRVQQLHADPHLLRISEALVPGVVGAVLPKLWGDTGCPGGGGRGCLRGLSLTPSGARPTGLLCSGSRPLPLGLEARRRAAYPALLLLGAGCRPGGLPLCPGSGRRVPLLQGGRAKLRPVLVKMAKASSAPPPGCTKAPHAM
jgi:hypothetical protein